MSLTTHDWNKLYSLGQTPWRETADLSRFLEVAGVKRGSALDMGCGTGEDALWLSQHGFEVEALDYSAEALKIARGQGGKVNWVEWDLERLADYPFRHRTYNLVNDRKVLAFINDKARYLDTILSRLDGVYLLTVFHEHDEKQDICVSKEDFDLLISPRFSEKAAIQHKTRPGKVVVTYLLEKM